MNIRKPFYTISISALALFTTLGVAVEPSLKEIMQDLRDDTAGIANGLLVEDFQAIADSAGRIASHPQIPAEQVQLVAAELGAEMAAFKQFDTLVHDLSLSIAAAAKEGDTSLAASHYHSMLDGCLACHASYRERVADVLANAESNKN